MYMAAWENLKIFLNIQGVIIFKIQLWLCSWNLTSVYFSYYLRICRGSFTKFQKRNTSYLQLNWANLRNTPAILIFADCHHYCKLRIVFTLYILQSNRSSLTLCQTFLVSVPVKKSRQFSIVFLLRKFILDLKYTI